MVTTSDHDPMDERPGTDRPPPNAATPDPTMTPDRATDEAILRAVQADEPGAFDRFVERFGNRIYAFGRRMCGHVEDAEDVAVAREALAELEAAEGQV